MAATASGEKQGSIKARSWACFSWSGTMLMLRSPTNLTAEAWCKQGGAWAVANWAQIVCGHLVGEGPMSGGCRVPTPQPQGCVLVQPTTVFTWKGQFFCNLQP